MIRTGSIDSCLGLDIAKAKLDACLLSGSRTHHAQFDNSKPGPASLRAWCKRHGIGETHSEATRREAPLVGEERLGSGRPAEVGSGMAPGSRYRAFAHRS